MPLYLVCTQLLLVMYCSWSGHCKSKDVHTRCHGSTKCVPLSPTNSGNNKWIAAKRSDLSSANGNNNSEKLRGFALPLQGHYVQLVTVLTEIISEKCSHLNSSILISCHVLIVKLQIGVPFSTFAHRERTVWYADALVPKATKTHF